MIICNCEDCVHNDGRMCDRDWIEISYEHKFTPSKKVELCASCEEYEKREDEV